MADIFDIAQDFADVFEGNGNGNGNGNGYNGDLGGPNAAEGTWATALGCVLLPTLYAVRQYTGRTWDRTWRLLPMYSVGILCVLTLYVAYYTQATSSTLCAMPAHVNQDYVHLYCGGHVFQYFSWFRDTYHQQLNSRYYNVRVYVTWYSYLPLVFGVLAIICFVPELVWIVLTDFGAKKLRLSYTMKALREDDDKACMDNFDNLRNAAVWSKLICCKLLSTVVAAACAAGCYYALFLSPIPLFPKEVICELPMQGNNQIQRELISCVMPQNHFTEQIFILLIFWFCFVFAANFLSIISWCIYCSRLVFACLVHDVQGVLPSSMLHSDMSYTQILSVTLAWQIGGCEMSNRYVRWISKSYCKRKGISDEGEGGMNGSHQEVDAPDPDGDYEDSEAEDGV